MSPSSVTIEEVRRENARRIVSEQCGNVQSKFGEKLDISRQLVNHYIGKNPIKVIGSDMARRIEEVFGRPIGWMDERHDAPGSASGPDVLIERLRDGSQFGSVPGVHAALVNQLGVTKEWLRRNVGARPSESLVLATVTGDSMAPTLSDGAMVLVDRSITSIADDGIYMLTRENSLQRDAPMFRRVSRKLDGSIVIRGDNPAAEAETHKSARAAGVLVLGRVVVSLEVRRV